jgi:cell division protein FtsB
MPKRSLIGKIAKSRFLVVVITVFLILFAIGFGRSFWRDYQIRQEIRQMEETRVALEEKKLKTLDLLEGLQGDEAAEKEARLNFGLVKPGEKVVVITDETTKINQTKLGDDFNKNKSNLILWWEYFFATK